MPTYDVKVPVAGYVALIIEADNEEMAIEQAMAHSLPLDAGPLTEPHTEFELDCYRHINKGNFCYLDTTDVEATEIDSDEEKEE